MDVARANRHFCTTFSPVVFFTVLAAGIIPFPCLPPFLDPCSVVLPPFVMTTNLYGITDPCSSSTSPCAFSPKMTVRRLSFFLILVQVPCSVLASTLRCFFEAESIAFSPRAPQPALLTAVRHASSLAPSPSSASDGL